MANNLTGDYEAVLQLAGRQINGLLATLHQNGVSDDAPLKLLHSADLSIGFPRRHRPDVTAFAEWLDAFEPVRSGNIPGELIDHAPAGAAARFRAAFDDLLTSGDIPPAVIRGRAKVQISSVRFSAPSGSTSEVILETAIRAQYTPVPDTNDLPAPIHGEVRASFVVHRTAGPKGWRLVVQPSPDDTKIRFLPAPGSGLSSADAATISEQLRKTLREGFSILPVDLPADFPFAEFKGIGHAPANVIALPLQLSGAPMPPATSLSTLTQAFTGSSGFAFGVNRDYVLSLVDVEQIRETIRNLPPIHKFGATYHLRFSSGPAFAFRQGSIEIRGTIAVETGAAWAPNGSVTFKQAIGIALDVTHQTITLVPLGPPSVDESWFISHSTAVHNVTTGIATALAANSPSVASVFDNAKTTLLRGLRNFEASATVTYSAVEITPDGVIVRGDIGTAARTAPVVRITKADGGASFSAFDSWIPGGAIDRFTWTWVEHSGITGNVTPWGGTMKSTADEHRFILPRPNGVTDSSSICLRVEGTRILPNGDVVPVAAGTTCNVQEPVVMMNVPSWWEPVTVPIWQPGAAETAAASDAVAAHVSVQADMPDNEPGQNTLVVFPDWEAQGPLATIGEAVAAMKRPRVALGIVVVLPAGSLAASLGELQRNVASIGDRFRYRVQVTDDQEGGWTRTFGVTRAPAAFLVDAHRELVWKHDGRIDPRALAAALDQHVTPASLPTSRPLQLAVAHGLRAPDLFFNDDSGRPYALHRLRGRHVLVNFWQSWSTPCLTELRRLRHLAARKDTNAPFIVSFHGGRDEKAAERIRKELALPFPVVQDAEQQMARQYGVRCWPTTVLLDADGRVERVQFGVQHEHR